jgi:hypothetical protein
MVLHTIQERRYLLFVVGGIAPAIMSGMGKRTWCMGGRGLDQLQALGATRSLARTMADGGCHHLRSIRRLSTPYVGATRQRVGLCSRVRPDRIAWWWSCCMLPGTANQPMPFLSPSIHPETLISFAPAALS